LILKHILYDLKNMKLPYKIHFSNTLIKVF
jgi:hypothetical protein